VAARRSISVEDVGEGFSGFLTREMLEQDSLDRLFVVPLLKNQWAYGLGDHNDVLVLGGDVFDKAIAVVPRG
jgi:hypothetical protein